jgi:hypothetical protein
LAKRAGIASAESVVALAILSLISFSGIQFAIVVVHNVHQIIAAIAGSPYL